MILVLTSISSGHSLVGRNHCYDAFDISGMLRTSHGQPLGLGVDEKEENCGEN